MAVLASLLLGVATAMVVVGLGRQFTETFGDRTAVHETVVATALLALAAGIRTPQRIAMWISLRAWRRFLSRGRPTDLSDVLVSGDPANRAAYRMAISVMALIAGIATALLPIGMRVTLAWHDWMRGHFVWSFGLSGVLETMVIVFSGFVPLAALGLAIALAHRLVCPFGQWDPKASAWLLIGAGPGIVISTLIHRTGNHTDLMLVTSALPALVVSLLAAGVKPSPAGDPQQDIGSSPAALPLSRDRWPRLLRASIVTVGAGAVWAVMVWSRALGDTTGHFVTLRSAMLLSLGVGILVGCGMNRSNVRSVGGFGVACVAAGVVVAIGLLAMLGRLDLSPKTTGLLACVGLASLGHAAAYGRQTLLRRVASRSYVGAAMLTRVLVYGAIAGWIGVPVAANLFGLPTALALLVVVLIGLGGTLIIHETTCSIRTRRARLAAVFAVVALIAILTLQPAGAAPRWSASPPDMSHNDTRGPVTDGHVPRPYDR